MVAGSDGVTTMASGVLVTDVALLLLSSLVLVVVVMVVVVGINYRL